jgi:glycosyltransferase involved in cell wall biosynthesis
VTVGKRCWNIPVDSKAGDLKMRIALAHKLYRTTGGAEVFFHETNRILRERGHETLLIATGSNADDTNDSNVLLLEAPDYESPSLLAKLRSFPATIYDNKKKAVVKEALREFKPDIFHVFSVNVRLSPSVIVAAAELGVPIVSSFNDYKHICPAFKMFHHGQRCTDCHGKDFYHAILNNCCGYSMIRSGAATVEAYLHRAMGIYAKIDHFTFASEFMAKTTQGFWSERHISWSKLRNPFDSAGVQPTYQYDEFGLYFGRLVEEKGVDRLVSAAAQIKEFPIKIIGDGPELNKLQEQSKSLGLFNIEFLGPMWGETLNDILSRARFVVVPSLWEENLPYVINQSFSQGKPVIGACRGGIPELVQHGVTGLIFEPDNPNELPSAIMHFATSKDSAQQMGEAAKRWSDETFNDDMFYSNLMFAYERAANQNRNHRR